MNKKYVSPIDQSPLRYEKNQFVDSKGNIFPIRDGIPNLIFPKNLDKSDLDSIDWYKKNASCYDDYLPMTFDTFGVNEDEERQKLIDALKLKIIRFETYGNEGIEKIASELNEDGELYLQDISEEILKIGIENYLKSHLNQI